jgi:hypothetical protein
MGLEKANTNHVIDDDIENLKLCRCERVSALSFQSSPREAASPLQLTHTIGGGGRVTRVVTTIISCDYANVSNVYCRANLKIKGLGPLGLSLAEPTI